MGTNWRLFCLGNVLQMPCDALRGILTLTFDIAFFIFFFFYLFLATLRLFRLAYILLIN
jgi:hypothetical protein